MSRHGALCAAAALGLLLAAPAWGQLDLSIDDAPPSDLDKLGPVLTVQSVPLNPYNRYLDGNWQSGLVGSDGNFYFGASTHHYTHSGMFFRYVTGTGQLEVLSPNVSVDSHELDANQVPDPNYVPQGKMHSQLVEMNGWVYGSTHLANYSSPRPADYTGSHVLGWNMETGASRDLGVTYGEHGYTAYSALAGDADRGYVYSLVTNWAGGGTRMVRLTLPQDPADTVDHDDPNQYRHWQVSPYGSVAGLAGFVDDEGYMWFTHNAPFDTYPWTRGGGLYSIDPDGNLRAWDNYLPEHRNPLTDVPEPNVPSSMRYWQWGSRLKLEDKLHWDAQEDLYVFTQPGDGGLWVFNAAAARANNGPIGESPFLLINYLTSTHLGSTIAGDTLYYVDNADPNNLEAKSRDLRLYSVDLSEPFAAIVDWGRIVDQDGRTPYRIETIAADELGHVFLTGDFRVNAGDPNEYRTICNQFGENLGDEVELWRGHFFATVTVPEPATLGLILAGLAGFALRRRIKACAKT